ncbi:MAG: YggS family pyridoxal phosphate-dependent enzyme [Ignavibacteria bacterium]|nr:YggS family pyridoxal phosphate-dependent enzyme [Ignavibacteria bacterium]
MRDMASPNAYMSDFPIDFGSIFGYIHFLKSGKMVAENLETVKRLILGSCLRCGRDPNDVLVVGITKTFGPEMIRQAVASGMFDIGESYVQELNRKRQLVSDERIRWHFVGHLQSNKVKYIAEYVHLIHSVDNIHLAGELQKRGEQANRLIDVLVEVRTTDEATKFGVEPEKTTELVKQISKLGRVRVRGLMTMGPFAEDPNRSRPSFQRVCELKRSIDREGIDNVSMEHLSMGMSHDFEVGIEEGATIVRLGTAIFGTRSGVT